MRWRKLRTQIFTMLSLDKQNACDTKRVARCLVDMCTLSRSLSYRRLAEFFHVAPVHHSLALSYIRPIEAVYVAHTLSSGLVLVG